MKHINLLSFSDACSIGLLRFLDYDENFWSTVNDNILINIKLKRNKDKFIKRVLDVIYENTSFGSTLLVCNSCKSTENWRRESQTIPLGKQFEIIDESILICPPFLEEAILGAWNSIEETNVIKKFKVKELDSIDMKMIIKNQIGEIFIKEITPDVPMLKETNELFIRSSLQKEIPNYFNTTLENLLISKNINQ